MAACGGGDPETAKVFTDSSSSSTSTSTTSTTAPEQTTGDTAAAGGPSSSTVTVPARVRATTTVARGPSTSALPPTSGVATVPTTASTTSTTTAGPGGDGRVAAARADLAGRFGYAPAEIDVASVEDVTWPNTALGCPDKDALYAQVLTDGYRIVLRWRTRTYLYHGATGQPPFLCQNPE